MGISEKWKDTMKKGIGDPAWSAYDKTIKDEVDAYTVKFAGTPDFQALNWKLVKAMLWTESGGPTNQAWNTRPMQIGNSGDPAYAVLKAGKEGSSEIMDAATWSEVKTDINKPKVNIKAGIAYLYTRLAKFEIKSVLDKNTSIHSHTVVKGDSLSKIAATEGTTVDELTSQNKAEDLKVLKPKQVVKFRKASMRQVIVGWRSFTAAEIGQRYNGGGDQLYAQKLSYLIDTIFPELEKEPTKVEPKK